MLAQDAEGVGSWTQAVSSRRRADDAGDMTDDEQQSGDAKLTESGLGAKEKEKREADDGQDDDTEKGDLGRGLGTGPWACHGGRGRSGVLGMGPWVLGSCTAVVYWY